MMENPDPGADPARARFLAIGITRLIGVASAFLGAAFIARRWIEPADIIGGLLIANGVVDVLILPIILAKRWRTPPK